MATYAPATHAQLRSSLGHRTGGHHWLLAIGLILLGMIVLGELANTQAPAPVHCRPPACTLPPPRVQPLVDGSTYTSSQYGYSLQYSTQNITPSQVTGSTIAWDATLQDNSEVSWAFTGTNPQGRGAQTIVGDVQANNFPDATLAFTIPGADIGYTPGYGNVYDLTTSPGNGQAVHQRLVVMAAIKRGIAVVVVGLGPYQQTDPQSDGHPSPADTPLVHLGDFQESLESVTWPGDPKL